MLSDAVKDHKILVLSDCDDILAHEAAAWEELVHEVAVLDVSIIFRPVGNAIPWLNTDERSMLAAGCPEPHCRCLDVERHVGLASLIEEFDMPELTVVEDDGIVLETVFRKMEQAFIGLHLVIAFGQAAFNIGIETHGLGIV